MKKTNFIVPVFANSSRISAVLSLATLAMAVPVSAASYLGSTYEGFDYSTGSLSGRSGGTGFNSTGDDELANTTSWGVQTGITIGNVTAGSLSHSATGYTASTGNKLTLDGTTSSQNGLRHLGQTVATNSTGSMYFSFLMQKTNDSNRSMNFSFFDGTTELFAIGQNNAAPSGNLGQLGVVTIAGTPSTNTYHYPTSSLTLGNDVHLIIGRMDFNVSGQTDRLTLWVNPADVTGGEGSLTAYQTVDFALRTSNFNTIRPFAGGDTTGFGAVTANFDEIRFGDSFNSVSIPEPTAALLGSLGMLFLLRRRRP